MKIKKKDHIYLIHIFQIFLFNKNSKTSHGKNVFIEKEI